MLSTQLGSTTIFHDFPVNMIKKMGFHFWFKYSFNNHETFILLMAMWKQTRLGISSTGIQGLLVTTWKQTSTQFLEVGIQGKKELVLNSLAWGEFSCFMSSCKLQQKAWEHFPSRVYHPSPPLHSLLLQLFPDCPPVSAKVYLQGCT